jgi:hypothetical protein
MEKKQYVKPTLERQAIFSYEAGYLSFGKEHPRWLYVKEGGRKDV